MLIAKSRECVDLWVDHPPVLNRFFYGCECSGSASKQEWTLLKGKMEVSAAPIKALVYLEGPPLGVDILTSYFSIAPSKPEPVRSFLTLIHRSMEISFSLQKSLIVLWSFDLHRNVNIHVVCEQLNSMVSGQTSILHTMHPVTISGCLSVWCC